MAERRLWPDDAPLKARIAAVHRYTASLDGTEQEGVVVCDAGFGRLKFKSPGYLARHWRFPLRGTGRQLPRVKYLAVICADEVDEFLAVCPLQRPFVEAVLAQLAALSERIEAELAELAAVPSGRAFAAAVQGRPHAGVLFQRKKQPEVPTAVVLRRYRPDLLERMLGGAS